MKKIFRIIFGFIVVSPFIVAVKFLSVFLGEDKAIDFVGPFATKLAIQALKLWVPHIDNPEDFDSLPAKMKKNFWLWKPFYDIEILQETGDIFKLHLSNCPFCEVLNSFKLGRLGAYICKGDWAVAQENSDKWIFERNHQIGTGDSYCDHTYKRIK